MMQCKAGSGFAGTAGRVSLLLLAFSTTSLFGVEPESRTSRDIDFIIEGSAASTADFPWMVSIFVTSASNPDMGGVVAVP